MIKIELETWGLRKIFKESPEKFEFIREHFPTVPPMKKKKDSDEFDVDSYYASCEGFVNDPQLVPEWLAAEAKLSIPKFMRFSLEEKLSETKVGELFCRMQVHLPGNELLGIDEVFVLNDACTESLQENLDQGYRIIAIQPITGQRRPDYILGRGPEIRARIDKAAYEKTIKRPETESDGIPF